MKKGDIIEISYTAKDLSSGNVFDTTEEKAAKEAGIARENFAYGPVTIVVGKGEVLKGLDEALTGMEVGEEKAVSIPPEKGFGERKADLVGVVPLQEFKQRKLSPVPGMVVNMNDRYGKVQSVSGGRVRVDFNHELAGKTLEYQVKVERQLTEPLEQATGLFKKLFAYIKEPQLKVEGETLEAVIPAEFAQQAFPFKQLYAKTAVESIEAVKKVRFIEEFDAASFAQK